MDGWHSRKENQHQWRIRQRARVTLDEVSSILQAYENRSQNTRVRVIKEGRRANIFAVTVCEDERQARVCLKQYLFSGLLGILKHTVLPSRAMRSFKTAARFRHLGINTAAPLAVLEKRQVLLPIDSLLIMEDISSHHGLPEYLESQFSPLPPKRQFREKRTFIKEFAQFIADLHGKGVYHADLKTTNIFVEEVSLQQRSFWLIDLDRVMFRRKLSSRQKLSNLVQINTSVPAHMSLTDRLRFYHDYTGKKRLEKGDKGFLAAIIQRSWKRNPHWHPRFGMNAALIRTWE